MAPDPTPLPWDFESDEQREAMLEPITPQNCWKKLKLIRDIAGMSRRDLATVIGVSESTIFRLETRKTLPSNDFMLRLSGLVAIGHAKFSRMSDTEKEKFSEYLGASGGVAAGIGGALGAVSASGAVAGLSAAGITSGLAAIGGTMLGGLAVVAAIRPAAASSCAISPATPRTRSPAAF